MTMSLNQHHVLDQAAPTTAPRPRRIGIALGGGAARGWAHIGVIRELLAQGIVPSVVAGTSIGAIAGASYAAGRLDHLEDFARSLNVRRVLTLMDFSFGGTGLVKGDRLRRRLQHDLKGFSIETLPLPFTAVATEMTTGHEVWLSQGDLVEFIAGILCPAWRFRAHSTWRTLAFRRRHGQSDPRLGLPGDGRRFCDRHQCQRRMRCPRDPGAKFGYVDDGSDQRQSTRGGNRCSPGIEDAPAFSTAQLLHETK